MRKCSLKALTSGAVATRATVARQLAVEELDHEVLDRGVELGAADPQPVVLSYQRVRFVHLGITHLNQQDRNSGGCAMESHRFS